MSARVMAASACRRVAVLVAVAMLAVAMLAVAALAGCGSEASGPTTSTPTPSPLIPAGGAGFTYNGITHTSWMRDGYAESEGPGSRQALAATRANWSGLLVTWYMDTRTSNTIAPSASTSPADSAVAGAIDELHGLGLEVMLKPHVDVHDGTWRAQITPADRGAWWASYAAFLDHYAALAAARNVGMLCIGTELASMSGARDADEWAQLIHKIRGRYGGLLTYAANGVDAADEFTAVSFWGRLDLMGADVYTPLTDSNSPTRAELVAAWRANRNGHDMVAAFRNAQHAYGKPFIFTEIGYRSGDGANRAPWDWGKTLTPDPAEQADCYAAMYEVWSGEASWMKGSFWWSWDVAAPGPVDTGYNPRGKPAEDQLRGWQ